MNTIIRELRSDHHNIARILVLIRISLGFIKDQSSKEHVTLMRECLDYMITYPDEIHHPKEDVMFDLLIERDSSVQVFIENLLAEHKLLASKSRNLHETLCAVEEGYIVPRDQLAVMCSDYIDTQFRHMRYEELSVFPVMEQKLTLSDWKTIIKDAPSGDDPIFNEKRDKYYNAVHARLMETYHIPKD